MVDTQALHKKTPILLIIFNLQHTIKFACLEAHTCSHVRKSIEIKLTLKKLPQLMLHMTLIPTIQQYLSGGLQCPQPLLRTQM